ncbi:hypothetical protein GCM10028807_57890 [Spirosoma daeguense]
MYQTATPIVTIDRQSRAADPQLGKLKALLSIDFDDHDTRLGQCILSAKQRIEKVTGLLLDKATVTIRWSQLYDFERVPFGPINGAIIAKDLSDTVLTVDGLSGSFPTLTGNYPKGVQISYSAGYGEENPMPDDLVESVLNLAANLFDNGSRNWKEGAVLYRQYTWAS